MAENAYSRIHKIVVTGTKGKTTICNLIDFVLRKSGKSSLLVDSTGSYLNGSQQSTFEDSLKIFGKSPNVMPGRYLYWNLSNGHLHEGDYGVFEASFANATWGLGFKGFETGILSNVYRDHLDFEKLKSEQDLYKKKSFIFRQLKDGGNFISYLDHEFGVKALRECKQENRKIKRTGFTSKSIGAEYDRLQLDEIIYVQNGQLFSQNSGKILDLSTYKYWYGEANDPMVINLGLSAAALLQFVSAELLATAVGQYQLPENYGRMLSYEGNGKIVIIDYAHEPSSLRILAENLNKRYQIQPYLITRIAPDRNDAAIKDYAKELGKLKQISGMTVYDKIDDEYRKEYTGRKISRQAGESSRKLYNALRGNIPKYTVKRIVKEIEALADALNSGNDLIVLIASNLEVALNYLKENGYERKN